MHLLLLAVLLIGAGYWFWRYRRAGRRNAAGASAKALEVPGKVLNPHAYAGMKSILAWEFMAPNLSQACRFARDNAGLRRPAQACTPLPEPHCDSGACLCHYRPIFEERRRQRRNAQDRRTEYRMDDKADRRERFDRRKDHGHWNQDTDRD